MNLVREFLNLIMQGRCSVVSGLCLSDTIHYFLDEVPDPVRVDIPGGVYLRTRSRSLESLCKIVPGSSSRHGLSAVLIADACWMPLSKTAHVPAPMRR